MHGENRLTYKLSSAISLLLLLSSTILLAQAGSNAAIPHDGGLVVFKGQSYYTDDLADAIVFTKSIPRGPSTTLVLGINGEKGIVPEEGILGWYSAQEINVTYLAHGTTFEVYKEIPKRLVELSRLNERVAAVVAPILAMVKSNVQQVESGSILVNGVWKNQEEQLAQLKEEEKARGEEKSAELAALKIEELTRQKEVEEKAKADELAQKAIAEENRITQSNQLRDQSAIEATKDNYDQAIDFLTQAMKADPREGDADKIASLKKKKVLKTDLGI
jgi:hypothetical protein